MFNFFIIIAFMITWFVVFTFLDNCFPTLPKVYYATVGGIMVMIYISLLK